MAQPYQQVSPLSSISYMQEQYEAGRERRKQQQLGQLASQAYAPGADQQSILQQAAAIDPKAAGDIQTQMDAQQRKVIGAAGYMRNALATGNPMAIQGAWRTVRKGLIQSGIGTEQDYQEQWQPEYEQFVHQMLASGAGSSGTGVQSTYVDDQGNRVAILRDGSTRVLGANAANNQIIDTGAGGFYGVNKGTLAATPVAVGGGQAQQPTRFRAQNGEIVQIDQVPDPALRAQIMANPEEWGLVPDGGIITGAIGGQLMNRPQTTPYQQAQLDAQYRDDARADRSLQLQESAAEQRLADQRMAAQEKRLAVARAAQGVIDSTDDALATIQRLRNHAGYRALGTVMGDAATGVPLLRTDAKGANAILETIKAQSLINTLSALKSASSTGASGFGSLTEKEGQALQSSMANLSTAQSHADLDSALNQIETILQRTRNRTLDSVQARGGSLAPSTAPEGNTIQTTPQVRRYNPATGRLE